MGNKNFSKSLRRLPFVLRPSCFLIFPWVFALSLFIPLSLHAADISAKEQPRLDEMTSAQKAEWVKSLSPAEKAELLRKQESYEKLSPAEQEKLRHLHEDLKNDKEAADLRRIMNNYYQWWKSLPLNYRAELSTLPPEERLQRISQLRQEESRRKASRTFTDQDIAALREWMEQYVKKFEARHRESISAQERKRWDEKPEPQRRWEMMRFLLWQRGQGGGNKTLQTPEDLAELRAKLSPEIQNLLVDKSPEEQWKKIQSWLPAIARQQFAARSGRRPGSLVDENELANFFESLPNQERMRLLDFPPEDMQHELQRMYLSRKKPMESFFGRPESPLSHGPGGSPDNPERTRPNKTEKATENSKKTQ